jgi:hypothetical protein
MPPEQQPPTLPPQLLLERQSLIDELIGKYAIQSNLPPEALRAVVEVESGFNPQAVSPKGAMGLMQLMPGTAEQYGVTDPFDPEQNIRAGSAYLRSLYDRYEDNQDLALAAYNAGPTAIEQYGGQVPPFPETTDFIRRVRAAQQPAGVQQAQAETEHTGTVWFNRQDRERGLGGGIRIGYTGNAPTPEEQSQIREAVSPGGLITREDAPLVGGGIGGLLAGTRRVPWTKLRNPLAVAPSLVAGAGGVGAELWRQEQIPETVTVGNREFDILGWPQPTFFGTTVEGAPRTPEDKLWTAAVRGTEQLLGEKAAGWLTGLFFRWPGRMLQKSGFRGGPKLELELQYPKQNILRLSQEMSKGYIRRGAPGVVGFGPTKGAYHRAVGLRNLSARLANQMIEPYQNQTVNPVKIRDRVGDLLGPTFRKETQLGQPTAENQLITILDSFLTEHGFDPTGAPLRGALPLTVARASELKRMADRMATPAWLGQTSQNLTTPARPEVSKAFSQALREAIEERLPEGVKQSWRTQNTRTQAAIALSTMIQQAQGGSMLSGVGAGMAAGAGLGSVATGSANPLLAVAPILPFLSPTGRSVMGRTATQAGRVPLIPVAGRGGMLLDENDPRPRQEGSNIPVLGADVSRMADQVSGQVRGIVDPILQSPLFQDIRRQSLRFPRLTDPRASGPPPAPQARIRR